MDDNEWLDFEEDETTIDSSFPATFASFFSAEIRDILQKEFDAIGNTWLNMGISMNKRDEKVGLLRNGILEFVKTFQDQEMDELKRLQSFREYKLNDINKILKDLSLEKYSIDSSRTLLVQNKLLSLKHKELLYVKSERMEHLERITEKFKKVCHSLGTLYQEPVFSTNIPSERELMDLRSVLLTQEQQLESRKKRFESLQALVVKYQNELEYLPQDKQERMFLSSSSDIIYSQQNQTLISDFYKKIAQLFNQAKEEIEELKCTIGRLFDRLSISDNVRKAFYQTLTGSFPRIKQLLNIEIEKYEKLKKSCMERIIKNIRTELGQLFQECMVDDKFNIDYILESQDFTEELLVLHENELAKLNEFKKLYLGVFEKLNEFQDSLGKLEELEKKSLDPNRFNNRGGALLQNERDRKLLSKKLPRLEKEIKSLVTMIESKENIPFNSFGLDINKYFADNWSHLKDSKDSAKNVASKISGCDSAKKPNSVTGSSQKRFRYPLSPRTNNSKSKLPGTKASRQLFTPMEEKEVEFRKHLLKQEQLQSTFMDDNFISTPTPVSYLKNTRRLSKSCENLNNFPNKGAALIGVTRREKKPPFLP